MRSILFISLMVSGISFRASAATIPLAENTVNVENDLSYLFSPEQQTPEKPGFSQNRKNDQPPARRVRRRTRRRTRRRVERRQEKTGFYMHVQQLQTTGNTFTAIPC